MEKFVVSARKYRPQNFSTVVGQSHITTTLKNAINNNQLAHAFLFCGPRGVGKTTCARILAKTINCENRTAEGEACNSCNSCVSFDNGTSLNIHELDAASNNSVDDIRSLVEQVRFAPQGGAYKVYIVDEVHMLSSSAFNAFLKTLEEPPPYAIFILATTEKHKILPTILSRCQIFDFKRITTNDTVEHLQEICEKEKIEADASALHVIAQKSEGCMRDALSILDKIVSFTNGHLEYSNTLEHLNILDEDYYFRLLDYMMLQELTDTMLLFDEINQKGFEGDTFLDGFAEFLRNLLVSKEPKAISLLEVSESFKKRYIQSSAALSAGWMIAALNIINECSINFKQARNKRLHIEMALIKLTYLQQAIEIVDSGDGISKKKITDGKSLSFKNIPFVEWKPVSARPDDGKKVSEKPVLIIEQEKEKKPEIIQPVKEETTASKPTSFGSLNSIRKKVSALRQTDAGSKELTTETAQEAWNLFIVKLEERKNHSAVTNFRMCELVIQVEHCIEIIVQTAFHQKFIEAERSELVDHLQSFFNNKFLIYQFRIVEKELAPVDESKPLNRKQQFQKLVEKYPKVKDLKDRLRLDLQ